MKKRINFIDALYSNEGHYSNDIINYSYLARDYELHYFVNGKITDAHKNKLNAFILHELDCKQSMLGTILFLAKIRASLLKENFNFIMSVKYIPLYIFSLIFKFYNYFLLIHFFPTKNVAINKHIFRIINSRANGMFALDSYVISDIVMNTGIKDKISVIHSRDILPFNSTPHTESNKYTISFIGAMNQHKNVTDLILLLKNNYFPNIDFHFYSKGISSFLKQLNTQNSIKVIDEYFSTELYHSYLSESDYLYLSYEESYGVRVPGMVLDGLNYGCKLICNNNPSFIYYINKYNAGKLFHSTDELKAILYNIQDEPINKNIYSDYSAETREKLFNEALNIFFGGGICR